MNSFRYWGTKESTVSVADKVAANTSLQTVCEQQVDTREERKAYIILDIAAFFRKRSVGCAEEPHIDSNATLYRVGSHFRTVSKLVLNSSDKEYDNFSIVISIDSQQFMPVENQKILGRSLKKL
ncbi:unnamed protein product [Wuchereria bancrofti]|uniref:Uncharacterized protein n=1 Tax=Wuchereria bancrofti TaxID=6293 RepID=A0A3P7FUN0_WUCBA|nr:unnamed protein product [Wuchereria bancrofti]